MTTMWTRKLRKREKNMFMEINVVARGKERRTENTGDDAR